MSRRPPPPPPPPPVTVHRQDAGEPWASLGIALLMASGGLGVLALAVLLVR